jgi:hypothetical protein
VGVFFLLCFADVSVPLFRTQAMKKAEKQRFGQHKKRQEFLAKQKETVSKREKKKAPAGPATGTGNFGNVSAYLESARAEVSPKPTRKHPTIRSERSLKDGAGNPTARAKRSGQYPCRPLVHPFLLVQLPFSSFVQLPFSSFVELPSSSFVQLAFWSAVAFSSTGVRERHFFARFATYFPLLVLSLLVLPLLVELSLVLRSIWARFARVWSGARRQSARNCWIWRVWLPLHS